MGALAQRLAAGGLLLLDGAWGTQLQQRGLPPGACPDAWSVDRPDEVTAVAKAYAEAGSRAVLTNSFGANRVVLGRHGQDQRVSEINQASVAASRRGAAGRALVIASMGPCGRLLAADEISAAELEAVFAEQAAALAAAGADAVVVETMADPDEAAIAVRACVAAGLDCVCSFTFDSGRNRDRTMCGCTPERAAEAAAAAGALMVGANCGLGPDLLAPLLPRLAAVGLPVWAKPNAGLPGGVVDRDRLADAIAALAGPGVAALGACCGSDPDLIAAVAARLG